MKTWAWGRPHDTDGEGYGSTMIEAKYEERLQVVPEFEGFESK
jgi:hypothetical protein